MNRDAIEQEAMQFLQRGNSEKALDRYLAILRHEPKDRRIRQKVAELCLGLGKKAEAIRHFAEVARALKSGGQERAAISIYTQLVELSPQDNDVRAELAECLEAAGRRNEARKVWEDAFQTVDRREPRKAIEYARRVARLAPAEVPMHIRVAELLEGSRQEAEAFEAWKTLGDEARRLGRTDDRARFFERALKLRSNDPACLLSAAEARLILGEARAALVHLQIAYGQDPRSVGVLTLLGKALQALDQKDKARKVWLQAARRLDESGDREAQVEALQRALECGADDDSIRSQLDRVTAEARRQKMRLTERAWAQPSDPDEVRVLVRASVLQRYGFLDRAVLCLDEAPAAVREGIACQVMRGELLVAAGRLEEGGQVLKALRPSGGTAVVDLADRLGVLGLTLDELPRDETEEAILDDETDNSGASTLAVPVQSRPPVDPTPPPPTGQSAESDGDALAMQGQIPQAIAAYRRALSTDPSNTELLLKIGELMNSTRTQASVPTPVEPPPSTELEEVPLTMPGEGISFSLDGSFAEVDGDALDAMSDAITDARAMVCVGMFDEALDLLRGNDDVESLVVQALAARGLGRADSVIGRLERAVQVGGDHHPAYVEAMWELAGAYLVRKRAGNAERLLDEIEQLDPTWRTNEMAARRRGIELLRKR